MYAEVKDEKKLACLKSLTKEKSRKNIACYLSWHIKDFEKYV
jgi:hypothetical protein